MIDFKNNVFSLKTDNTIYRFELLNTGHLRHLFYGDCESVVDYKKGKDIGNSIKYSQDKELFLEDEMLEISSLGKGDIKEPFIELINPDGSLTSDFLYVSHVIDDREPFLEKLPSSYGSNEHLCVTLKDRNFDIVLEIHYFLYMESDVITKYARLFNNTDKKIFINKIMSNQLDFINDRKRFTAFKGSWANEFHKVSSEISQIRLVNCSNTGTSSSRSNPFVMISDNGADENNGCVYGFNLVYSGNHYESIDTSIQNKSRFLQGINPDGFSYELNSLEIFETPEAVMTCSRNGFNGMSKNMHRFIRNNIVRGKYKNNERPILVNTWEAFYFDIEERKLFDLASKAKELGIELFVVDDGWFKKRNDDTSSLGDWDCDLKKIPNGLKNIADNIGVNFGLWIEPEMVNENSDLYREHKEWTIEYDNHSEGRNQRILDLSNNETVDYLIDKISALLKESGCRYVKWDFNRIFSDVYSSSLKNQQELIFRYYQGFYRLCKELNNRFPEILFEGCAAGGNRFDLGILCFFPQIWASDNTDADDRRRMLINYSYGYPQSVIGAHVSACPNHQTGRTFPLSFRYDVAKLGCFGYELDLTKLSDVELTEIEQQIKDYKNNRKLYQYGQIERIDDHHLLVSDDEQTVMIDYSVYKD